MVPFFFEFFGRIYVVKCLEPFGSFFINIEQKNKGYVKIDGIPFKVK